MNWQIKTVVTDSFSMDCLQFGCGGEPLVILPGASVQSVLGAADSIVDAYAALANNFEIHLLDYRKSFPNPYPVRDMARDAYEALRALGLTRAFMFGASLGGMVAIELAAEHPEFARKLALGSTTAQLPESRRPPSRVRSRA